MLGEHYLVDIVIVAEVESQGSVVGIEARVPILVGGVGQSHLTAMLLIEMAGVGHYRIVRQILVEINLKLRAHGKQSLDIALGEQTVFVRRDIEQQARVRADGVIIDLHKLRQRFHLIVLVEMIEPAFSYRDIDLCGIPNELRDVLYRLAAAEVERGSAYPLRRLLRGLLRRGSYQLLIAVIIRHDIPLALAADSRLVSAPADIRARDGNDRLGLALADKLIVALPVIFLLASVLALAARAVEPDAEYVAVVRQQLAQLILEIFIIRLALAVAGIVPVPR